MELQLHGGGTASVSETLFGQEFNEALIHQAVVAFLAGARSGTKAQKSRAEVRGGGIKPWRQKGTGRARAGSIRSPIWVGGGRAFDAKPRSYKQKINKKMYRGAMRSILSELVKQDRLILVDSFEIDAPKTKLFLEKLKLITDSKSVLLIFDEIVENVFLASRNVPEVEVILATELNPVSLIRREKVVLTTRALKYVEEWLG